MARRLEKETNQINNMFDDVNNITYFDTLTDKNEEGKLLKYEKVIGEKYAMIKNVRGREELIPAKRIIKKQYEQYRP